MRERGKLNRVVSVLLALVVAFATLLTGTVNVEAAKIVGYTDPVDYDIVKVVKQKSYALVPGVTETDIVLNDQTGNAQVMAFLTTIEPSADVTLKATYAGLIQINGSYYYANSSGTIVVGEYNISKTNDLMPKGRYYFDEDGRMKILNGIIEDDGVMYYYVDNVKTYAGLIIVDDSYYYINRSGVVVTGEYNISKTNGLKPAGKYKFDESGKMIVKNGIIELNGVKYFYIEDEKVYAGLIYYDGSYYYVNSNGIVVTGEYNITKTNDIFPAGRYIFDENGKMIIKNGIIEENGVKHYYVDNIKIYAGLIFVDEFYYYVNSSGTVVTGEYNISKTNGLLPAGKYLFDNEGKLIFEKVQNIDSAILELSIDNEAEIAENISAEHSEITNDGVSIE